MVKGCPSLLRGSPIEIEKTFHSDAWNVYMFQVIQVKNLSRKRSTLNQSIGWQTFGIGFEPGFDKVLSGKQRYDVMTTVMTRLSNFYTLTKLLCLLYITIINITNNVCIMHRVHYRTCVCIFWLAKSF